MELFSIRNGYRETKLIEKEVIPDSLKNMIWNLLDYKVFHNDGIDFYDDYSIHFHVISFNFRHRFFNITVDGRSDDCAREKKYLRDLYFKSNFPRFYDLLEFLINLSVNNNDVNVDSESLKAQCNGVFEEKKIQFRFIGNQIAPITDEHEIEEINKATQNEWGGYHISQALELYKSNPPDYRNSIKESISAVEAVYRKITGEEHQDIGSGMKALKEKGIIIPSVLKEGFSKIYGWTCTENGIRHALMDPSVKVGENEARLMLVMCSTYINYLKVLCNQKL